MKQRTKARWYGALATLALTASLTTIASPASAAPTTAACSMHSVDSARLYNSAGLQVGSVTLYVDGCGNTRGYVRSVVYANLEVDLYSENSTYKETSCSGMNTLNCWSPVVRVGHVQVAAYGWIFNQSNGALVAYGTTGYHWAG